MGRWTGRWVGVVGGWAGSENSGKGGISFGVINGSIGFQGFPLLVKLIPKLEQTSAPPPLPLFLTCTLESSLDFTGSGGVWVVSSPAPPPSTSSAPPASGSSCNKLTHN